jgi:hypothetical protein
MSSLDWRKGRKVFGDGQDGSSDRKAFRPTLTFPLLPVHQFVISGGIIFCNLHRTFASYCGCLDGFRKVLVGSRPSPSSLVRCPRCLSVVDHVVPFAPYWSVAFVDGADAFLGKSVCPECWWSLTKQTYRAFLRYRGLLPNSRPKPAWSIIGQLSNCVRKMSKG